MTVVNSGLKELGGASVVLMIDYNGSGILLSCDKLIFDFI